MSNKNAAAPARADDDDLPWLRDGSVPHSREDRVAKALALIALIFSMGIGLVIALMPVSTRVGTVVGPATRSIEFPIQGSVDAPRADRRSQ